jgi:hypothetical protein
VTRSGLFKVVDFGLAKATHATLKTDGITESIADPVTRQGFPEASRSAAIRSSRPCWRSCAIRCHRLTSSAAARDRHGQEERPKPPAALSDISFCPRLGASQVWTSAALQNRIP